MGKAGVGYLEVMGLESIFGFIGLVLVRMGVGILSWKPSCLASSDDCRRGCGSEFCCHTGHIFGHCLFVYSVSGWKVKGGRDLNTQIHTDTTRNLPSSLASSLCFLHLSVTFRASEF